MSKATECPKCEGNMNRGRLYTPKSDSEDSKHIFDYVNWEAADEKKFGGLFAYKCDTCGFIEFYVERPPRKK
jgi:hypothetical protein